MQREGESVVAGGGSGGGAWEVREGGLGLVRAHQHRGGCPQLPRPFPQCGKRGTHALGWADCSCKVGNSEQTTVTSQSIHL